MKTNTHLLTCSNGTLGLVNDTTLSPDEKLVIVDAMIVLVELVYVQIIDELSENGYKEEVINILEVFNQKESEKRL